MAPSKKTTSSKGAPLDDGLDSFLQKIQPQKFSNDQAAGYFLVAFFMVLVPAYLYNSVYDLSLSEYGAVYLIITIAAAAALTLAYRNVQQGTQAYLSSSRKTGYYPQAKNADETDALIFQESLAWSMFLNNAIFIGSFLFLAFYVLRSVETLYNYILSNAIAAALTWQLSNSR